MVFIGIDPGKTGSITVLDEKEGTVNITSMPKTIAEMQDVFDSICSNRNMNELYAVLEQVHSMPGQGVASCFTFGKAYGWLQAMLAAHHIKTIEITPQKWMKLIGVLPKDKHARKIAIQDWVQKRIGRACGLGVADGVALAILCKEIWRLK